ncbi:MAG: hypothetical protein ACT6U0_11630 [Shinella sp.]|uniref:hypothetical protein n=1 Tax=Shinella sp. TaxID=1870904 RepID=UPI004036C6A7
MERHGGNHDVYRHPEKGDTQVPRHKEVTSGVARSIARKGGGCIALPNLMISASSVSQRLPMKECQGGPECSDILH